MFHPDYVAAVATNADVWVPAHKGTEMPFEIKGQRIQYCFNPALGQHEYYHLDHDRILTQVEVMRLLP